MGKNKPKLNQIEESLLEDKAALITIIQKVISSLIIETKCMRKQDTLFDCLQKPTITILDYLSRIAKFIRCSASVFVACLIYIDRLQQSLSKLIINEYNIHRLIIVTIMLAAKYLDDFYYTNQFYARVGGISLTDMNSLEIYVMQIFDFSIHISQKEFITYMRKLTNFWELHQ